MKPCMKAIMPVIFFVILYVLCRVPIETLNKYLKVPVVAMQSLGIRG